MKFILHITAYILSIHTVKDTAVPVSSVNYYKFNTSQMRWPSATQEMLLYKNNQSYPKYLENYNNLFKLNLERFKVKKTHGEEPPGEAANPNTTHEGDVPATSKAPIINSFPSAEIKCFVPHDYMILAYNQIIEDKYALNVDELEKRLFYVDQQTKPDSFYDYDEREEDPGSIDGYLFHNGAVLLFIPRVKTKISYTMVYFCENCGFYIHVDNKMLYLNVTVEHVLYLITVTFMQIILKMIDDKKWPFIACRTHNFNYLVPEHAQIIIGCALGHFDITDSIDAYFNSGWGGVFRNIFNYVRNY